MSKKGRIRIVNGVRVNWNFKLGIRKKKYGSPKRKKSGVKSLKDCGL